MFRRLALVFLALFFPFFGTANAQDVGRRLSESILGKSISEPPYVTADDFLVVRGGDLTRVPGDRLLDRVKGTNIVANNTALKSLIGTVGMRVVRSAFATDGDGGTMLYYWSASNCAAADDGAQVQPLGTGCWLADFASYARRPEVWGGVCDGTADAATKINAAISATQAAGGGIIRFSTKTCRIASVIRITNHNVSLAGDALYGTKFLCDTGINDCIDVGFQSYTVYGTDITRLTIQGAAGKTAGTAISLQSVGSTQLKSVITAGVPSALSVVTANNTYLDYLNLNPTGGVGNYGVSWTSPANNAARSDVLDINHTVVNAQWTGSDCYVLDGMVATLRIHHTNGLLCNYGLRVRNTAGSTQYFPSFIIADDLEIDGAKISALSIEAGRNLYFIDSFFNNDHSASGGQGGADGPAVQVLADATGSVTSDVRFIGGQMGISGQEAAVVAGKQIYFIGVAMRGSSMSSQYTYPSLRVTGNTTDDVQLSSVKFCGIFGDQIWNSYGVVADANVGNITNSNPDYNYCHSGTYSYAGSQFYTSNNGIDQNRNPIGSVIATAAIPASGLPIWTVGDTSGHYVSAALLNNNYLTITGSALAAGLAFDGSANASGNLILRSGSGGSVTIGAQTAPMVVSQAAGKLLLQLSNLPTSCTGLVSGDAWNNGNVVQLCP